MVPGAHIHTEHWARCGSESWLWGQQTQVRIWVLPLKSDVTWAGSAALPRLAPGSSENTHLPQALSWVTGSNGTTRLHCFSGLRTWPASLPYEAGWGSLCSLPAWWVGAPPGHLREPSPISPPPTGNALAPAAPWVRHPAHMVGIFPSLSEGHPSAGGPSTLWWDEREHGPRLSPRTPGTSVGHRLPAAGLRELLRSGEREGDSQREHEAGELTPGAPFILGHLRTGGPGRRLSIPVLCTQRAAAGGKSVQLGGNLGSPGHEFWGYEETPKKQSQQGSDLRTPQREGPHTSSGSQWKP